MADKVNFNRTQNSVSAYGDVIYKKNEKAKVDSSKKSLSRIFDIQDKAVSDKEKDTEVETVYADSITFFIDNWKGSMAKCVSTQDKVIDEEPMTFYYITGEIKKSDSDVMGMNDVSIQTVPGSPYFNIKAYDFWMLEPTEFLMISPFVKVGHVPVLWVPFYYHTENNLYFNPAYGYRKREGAVFQNTVYLMGTKPKNEEESDFSFLSFKQGEDSNHRELNGLSLVSSQDKTKYREDYSKIMADYYSKLGLYLGNKTHLTFDSYIDKITLDTGIAFSRNIDEDYGTVFNVITNESSWNNSYILGTKVPFRFSLSLEFETSILSGDFKTMSDPYFFLDFADREENFMWINHFTSQLDNADDLLNQSSGKNSFIRKSDDENIIKVDSYSWGVSFKSLRPNLKPVKPFINSFVFDLKNIKFDYKLNERVELDDNGEKVTIDSSDPTKEFFVPEKTSLPMNLTLTGDLFDSNYNYKSGKSTKKREFKYKFDNDKFHLDNPYEKEALEDEEEKKEEDSVLEDVFDLQPLDRYKDMKRKESNKLFETKLSYDVRLPLTLEWMYQNEEWKTPQDINYDLKEDYLRYSLNSSGTIKYSLKLLNSFIAIDDTLKGNLYEKRFANEDVELHSKNDILAGHRWSNTKLNNNVKVIVSPLKLFKPINYHNLTFTYNLDKILFTRLYDNKNSTVEDPKYEEKSFDWDKDYIKDNSIEGKYVLSLGFSTSTLSYHKKLEPIEEEYIAAGEQKFSFDLWLFNLTATGKIQYSESFITEINSEGKIVNQKGDIVTEEEDEWKKDPLAFTLTFKPLDKISLSSTVEYSLEDEDFQKFNNTIKLWALSIGFNSVYSKDKQWKNNTWSLIDDSNETLRLNNILTTFNLLNYKKWFWRNRVKLDLNTNLKYDMKMVEVNKSVLNLDFKLSLDIYEFLELKFHTISYNKSMFLYNSGDREILGIEKEYNLLEDLGKSFNFISDKDRKESLFNLDSINIDAVYKMPDWNLIFSYSGKPVLQREAKVYEWEQVFSFFIEWKPLKMVSSDVEYKEENNEKKWSASTSKKEK